MVFLGNIFVYSKARLNKTFVCLLQPQKPEKPQTQNRNHKPKTTREENGKEREEQEKKEEEKPKSLSASTKRGVLIA